VLVTGPTGSGKSTTLAAMIDYINRNRDDHIITSRTRSSSCTNHKRCLVHQREWACTRGVQGALRAALREDPDIVLVGELRDLRTISIGAERPRRRATWSSARCTQQPRRRPSTGSSTSSRRPAVADPDHDVGVAQGA